MLLKLRSQQHLCFPMLSIAPHRLLSLSLLLLLPLLLSVLLLLHSLLPNFSLSACRFAIMLKRMQNASPGGRFRAFQAAVRDEDKKRRREEEEKKRGREEEKERRREEEEKKSRRTDDKSELFLKAAGLERRLERNLWPHVSQKFRPILAFSLQGFFPLRLQCRRAKSLAQGVPQKGTCAKLLGTTKSFARGPCPKGLRPE